jgi:hypothetical protein
VAAEQITHLDPEIPTEDLKPLAVGVLP